MGGGGGGGGGGRGGGGGGVGGRLENLTEGRVREMSENHPDLVTQTLQNRHCARRKSHTPRHTGAHTRPALEEIQSDIGNILSARIQITEKETGEILFHSSEQLT